MRLFTCLVALAGIVALSLTAVSSPTEQNLPTVPSITVQAPNAEIASTNGDSESEVVVMKNWRETKGPVVSVKGRR